MEIAGRRNEIYILPRGYLTIKMQYGNDGAPYWVGCSNSVQGSRTSSELSAAIPGAEEPYQVISYSPCQLIVFYEICNDLREGFRLIFLDEMPGIL